MNTILITRSELIELLDPSAMLAALREAFIAYSTQRVVETVRVPLPLPIGAAPAGASGMLLAPGVISGIPAYSVKVHAKFPGSDPAIQGLLVLHDLSTGAPLAVMESSYLTALRTSLSGALAADALARGDARRLAIIGAGAQGRSQLDALQHVRSISGLRIFDVVPEKAVQLANELSSQRLDVTVAADLDEAIEDADIVVTATWATQPFLFRRHLKPGQHVTTLGPDQPGKCEVAADALLEARVIVDDRLLASSMGAIGGAGLTGAAIHAELGEVLAGVHPGRGNERDVTIFCSVGLAFQDLAAGWLAYRLAKRRGMGRAIDFLS